MKAIETQFPGPKDVVTFSAFFKQTLSNLHPVYFAMVMATGIISINFKLQGFDQAANLLFLINLIVYLYLIILFIMRAFQFPSNVVNDLCDHQRSPGFFTVVAASSIIGTQCYMIMNSSGGAQAFFGLALILWLLSIYTIFVLLTVKQNKPPFEEGINGGWLVSIVATQSIPVVGSIFLNPSENNDTILFILTAFWLFGGMLYIWIISIIFYRYIFFKFDPHDLMPPYWINMGAMAISSLAGSLILLKSENSSLIYPLFPFLKGLTLMYWATATWWIPMLFILGVWRHFIKKMPISYSPLYWGLVFPVGMYSVCTIRLKQVLPGVEWLGIVAGIFTVLGTCTWIITFLGAFTRMVYGILLWFSRKKIDLGHTASELSVRNNLTSGNVMVRLGRFLMVIAIAVYCINGLTPFSQLHVAEFFFTGGAVFWLTGLIRYLNGKIAFYTKR